MFCLLTLVRADITNKFAPPHTQRTITHAAFTKEAALVRSILNASMMYLIVKTCSDHMHHSCGCQSNQEYMEASPASTRPRHEVDSEVSLRGSLDANSPIGQVALNRHELRRLETGSPLRLTRSMIRHQGRIIFYRSTLDKQRLSMIHSLIFSLTTAGCNHNTAFADALTGIFMDADDVRSLNKAYKILNENPFNNRSGLSIDKRLVDADYKDLSFIKWAKSAINLHNNRVGRQVGIKLWCRHDYIVSRPL